MITYRGPSTKAVPPVPPNFVENFIVGGWRKIERMYGARDDRLLKWIEMSGGDDLYRARLERRRGAAVAVVLLALVARQNVQAVPAIDEAA
jgi:hypothetical protein